MSNIYGNMIIQDNNYFGSLNEKRDILEAIYEKDYNRAKTLLEKSKYLTDEDKKLYFTSIKTL